MRHRCAALLAMLLMSVGIASASGGVQTEGKLNVPEAAPLYAVCTDPTIQQTLEQDFRGAHRGPDSGGTALPVTITVTLNEKLLKPGIVLRDLGPGDPFEIARLLRAAGAEPPPIGDTGDKHLDPYEESARRQIMQPDDPMAALRNYEDFRNDARRPRDPTFGPNGNATDEEIYDRAIVARASIAGSPDQLMAVIIVHPRDDEHTAKELVAEEIANSLLH